MDRRINLPQERRQAGYSLIEVVVALGVFSATIFAYLYQASTAYQMMGFQMRRATATMVLENVVEDSMVYMKGSCEWLRIGNGWCHQRVYDQNTKRIYYDMHNASDVQYLDQHRFYDVSWVITEDRPIVGMTTADFLIEWPDDGETKQLRMQVIR